MYTDTIKILETTKEDTMNHHIKNSIYQKGERILLCGMTLAAVGLTASQAHSVKADEVAPTSQVTNSAKKENATPEEGVRTAEWNGLTVTFNDKTQTLTIPQGEISSNTPTPLGDIDKISSENIFHIKIAGSLKITGSASGLFANLPYLSSIEGLANVDTSEVTDMSNMFAGSFAKGTDKPQLDLSLLDTSNVEDMGGMFYGCEKLHDLYLAKDPAESNKFDTSKVTNMISMFNDCSSLTSITFSDNFVTSKVDYMDYMFTGDKSLTILDLSGFKFSNPDKSISSKNMLKGLDQLQRLTLPQNANLQDTGLNTPAIWQNANQNDDPKLTSSQLVAKYDGTSKDSSSIDYKRIAEAPNTPSEPSTPSVPSTSNSVTVPPTSNEKHEEQKPATNDKQAVKKVIMHNSYLYDQNGNRKDGKYLAGQSIQTYSTKIINGKKYYQLDDTTYVKANNITGVKRELTHNAYIYNAKGKRVTRKVLKKNHKVVTYGGTVKINGKRFYIIATNRFVKKANF